MQALLNLEGRNGSSLLINNMFPYSMLGRLWMNMYICKKKRKKERKQWFFLIASENSISLESVSPQDVYIINEKISYD